VAWTLPSRAINAISSANAFAIGAGRAVFRIMNALAMVIACFERLSNSRAA